MTCFLTQYSVYQLKIFLEGLWFLRQTITKQNGPQSTYKTIASGTFHFPISYILVEPITYQLLKQLSHLTTTLTSKWHDRWTTTNSNTQWNHILTSQRKTMDLNIIQWIHHLVHTNFGNNNYYYPMKKYQVDLIYFIHLLYVDYIYYVYIHKRL